MDKLWAPWRKRYLIRKPGRSCFACKIQRSKNDSKHFVLKRTAYSLSVLNLFPYNNGHVLVVPKRHVKYLHDLKNAEILDVIHLMNQTIQKIERTLKPHGFNLGINLGRAAGAGLPGHVHIHVVPRWSGDSNFMPIMGGTKVISDSLKSVYHTLK